MEDIKLYDMLISTTNITKEQLLLHCGSGHDWNISDNEAVELGICHGILGKKRTGVSSSSLF